MSLIEEVLFIEEGPSRVARRARKWKWLRRIGLTVLAGVALLVVVYGVVPAVHEARRGQCASQLKRLGLAFHEYHEANGHFPAPAIQGRDGKPLLSWRVALLPHLGEKALYDAFHREEPWDSPHNLALLSRMPAVFACPEGRGATDHATGYVVIVGPKTEIGSINTPFEPGRGVDIREVTDGTSQTILAAETNARVPWTKPDDPTWARDAPAPAFGSRHPGGFQALFADGATRFMRPTVEPAVLKAILTINGGEVASGGDD